MKKVIKIIFIVLGSILVLAIILGVGGWLYLKSTFLNFEKDYVENKDIKEITIDGYTFLDRNGNRQLDIYEDSRRSTEERSQDLLSQITLEEKIHLLTARFETTKTRYIKVLAENYGALPDWHLSAGEDAWLFMDEIIIE